MTGLNKVLLIGRIGKDPDIFTFENGNKKMSLTVATNENYRDRNSNEWIEQTEWHNVVGYGYLPEKNLVKGDLVYVEGKIKTRKWQDKDGNDRYTTEIVAEKINLLMKAGAGSQDYNKQPNTPQASPEEIKKDLSNDSTANTDNDLPF
jgi:single-strand DNA-binding protein